MPPNLTIRNPNKNRYAREEEEERIDEYYRAKQEKLDTDAEYKYRSNLIASATESIISKFTKYNEGKIKRDESVIAEQRNILDNFVKIHPEYKDKYDALITRIDKNRRNTNLYTKKMTQLFNKISHKTRKVRKNRKSRKNRK